MFMFSIGTSEGRLSRESWALPELKGVFTGEAVFMGRGALLRGEGASTGKGTTPRGEGAYTRAGDFHRWVTSGQGFLGEVQGKSWAS